MAELANKDRLQPALLDRLVDDEPHNSKEALTRRVLNLQQLRQSVMRDLSSLLNTAALDILVDLDDYPEVRQSVLNYGMPDLTGKTVSGMDFKELEQRVHDAIALFEPRIIKRTLRVTLMRDLSRLDNNSITFQIEGDLWAQPAPIQILLHTEVDLEAGEVLVKDAQGAR